MRYHSILVRHALRPGRLSLSVTPKIAIFDILTSSRYWRPFRFDNRRQASCMDALSRIIQTVLVRVFQHVTIPDIKWLNRPPRRGNGTVQPIRLHQHFYPLFSSIQAHKVRLKSPATVVRASAECSKISVLNNSEGFVQDWANINLTLWKKVRSIPHILCPWGKDVNHSISLQRRTWAGTYNLR